MMKMPVVAPCRTNSLMVFADLLPAPVAAWVTQGPRGEDIGMKCLTSEDDLLQKPVRDPGMTGDAV
jgi:hypothetical protein